MRFWKWNNAKLVINIDNITIIKASTSAVSKDRFHVYLTDNSCRALTHEEYQSLMNFIIENDK